MSYHRKLNGAPRPYSNITRRTGVIYTKKKEVKLNIDPSIITQYKNNDNKQIKVNDTQPQGDNERPEIMHPGEKRRKRKKKYLPGERLIMQLMKQRAEANQTKPEDENKSDDEELLDLNDAEQMSKITDSIRRVMSR